MAQKKNPTTMFGKQISGDMAEVLGIISMRRQSTADLAIVLEYNEYKVRNLIREIRKTFGKDSVSTRNGFMFEEHKPVQKEM